MWHQYGWMNGSGLYMWFFPILLLVVVILVLYWIFGQRGVRGYDRDSYVAHDGSREPRETALDMLKKRYAAGEIGKEEFDRIKKDLIE